MPLRANIIYKYITVLALLLSFSAGAAVCAQGYIQLLPNERFTGAAGDAEIGFQTDLTGDYIFYCTSSDPVAARVEQDGEIIAEGELPLRASLRAKAPVTVYIQANADYAFEIMRDSLGRNPLNPITLAGEALNRTITRAYDVHWYRYVSESDGHIMFRTERSVKGGVKAELFITDESGRSLCNSIRSENAESAFLSLDKGQTCLIRVSADGDATGNYAIYAQTADGFAAPERIVFPQSGTHMQAGEWTRLTPDIYPSDAIKTLAWRSDDEKVATVSSDGILTALSQGECTVTAYGFGGIRSSLRVSVSPAVLDGVSFSREDITLYAGDSVYVDWHAVPEYAGEPEVEFSVSSESVATISASGLLTGLSVGETEVTVRTKDGRFSATAVATVKAPDPVYRALAVGISSYSDGRKRMGCVNTTQGVADALSRTAFGKTGYLTNMTLDLSKAELFTAIAETFESAADADVSLIYINCHGGIKSGIAWLEMFDGGKVSARELENALRRVKGHVVLILDCCNSGAFIGKDSSGDAFGAGRTRDGATASPVTANAFASSKYTVVCSSSFDQNSYRMASASPASEANMSTVFARALTEALGWDLIKDKNSPMKADLNKDRQISLHEAFVYTYRRCMYYLKDYSAKQSVQSHPTGSGRTITR